MKRTVRCPLQTVVSCRPADICDRETAWDIPLSDWGCDRQILAIETAVSRGGAACSRPIEIICVTMQRCARIAARRTGNWEYGEKRRRAAALQTVNASTVTVAAVDGGTVLPLYNAHDAYLF